LSDFSANRSRDLEARTREIEDQLADMAARLTALESAAALNTSGGGTAATSAAAGGGGGGGGGGGTLAGDVTGLLGSNTVEAAQGVPLPVPVAADNHKVLAYVLGVPDYELLTPPFKVASTAIDLTLTADHMLVLVDATAGNRTITLPAAAGATDRVYLVKKTDSGSNTVTIDGAGAELIDGAATFVFNIPMELIGVASNGTAWYVW